MSELYVGKRTKHAGQEFIWNGARWVLFEHCSGPGFVTIIGPEGPDGKSAYQLAQAEGFVGTLEEWLASLEGADGQPGSDGQDGSDGAPGAPGAPGAAGKSAYTLAVEAGYVGTVTQWLESLEGADGQPGRDGVDGLPGAPGASGKSAYQLAVDAGFVGSEEDWLASLGGSSTAPGQDETPPADTANKLWFDPNALRLKFRYDDGDSSQWVDANPFGAGGGSYGGVVPIEPAQFVGSILQAISPTECAWEPPSVATELNVYATGQLLIDVDGSWILFSQSESGEKGMRTHKIILYVNSDTTISLISELCVRNTYLAEPYDGHGYLSLHDFDIVSMAGEEKARGFKHNHEQTAYLSDYLGTVSDPNDNRNIYKTATLFTGYLPIGTYLLTLRIDFNNDVPFYIDDSFRIEAAGGNATMLLVGDTCFADRVQVSF